MGTSFFSRTHKHSLISSVFVTMLGFLWPQLWKMVRSAATDEANAMGFLLLMGKFVKQMGTETSKNKGRDERSRELSLVCLLWDMDVMAKFHGRWGFSFLQEDKK
ncbi:hypothetical protein CUMW_112240 [Citrus unshiu]|nr:hypothetical protein CUMW_112240 [Citrus unshiu]